MEEESRNWSESVDDLVHRGDVDEAISLLERVVSNSSHSDLQLSSALFDLSKLFHSKGFSLKADEAHSRALVIRQQSQQTPNPQGDLKFSNKKSEEEGIAASRVSASNGSTDDGYRGKPSKMPADDLPHESCSDDDWEAIADRAPDELLPPECMPGVSKLSLEETKVKAPKRRGRGTFSYRKHSLYSDQQTDESNVDDSENGILCHSSEGDTEIRKALEACKCIQCPFPVRVLGENDDLLSSIPTKDLEPPRQRPETSARTAKRLIAHGMGIKLPSTAFGSSDLRKQEEARRNRIVSRQNMRDDAWGDDGRN
ncbi:uncharacterized protein LOC132306332 isoform X3 [Cornus florida]|uniref:uncharacterized protein LOC132306332 isoform X3 n=1 Tax=Cornus florida TaxID=4283 RepID=UPI002898D7A8|nr:uncharacterized protein LOC132306332 isoform X3 [Cornus florida]